MGEDKISRMVKEAEKKLTDEMEGKIKLDKDKKAVLKERIFNRPVPNTDEIMDLAKQLTKKYYK
jgi:hypothetical protein